MKTKTEEMYASMNPWRLFFKVAMPGMISMFAMSVYSIFEGIFIGQTLGEGAFAAINIAMPLVMINFSLSDLIGVGASVPISIALGQDDKETANNVFSCSVLMIFIAAILMGCVMTFAAEPLSRLMGAEGELLATSVRYLRTCALLGPFATIFFAMDNYLKISGYVKTSMAINIGSNLLTLGLLTFFLLGLQMDVVGSALAVSIARSVCSVVALIPFLRGKTLLKFTKPHFHLGMFKQIAACGSPVFLNNVAGRVTSILMNISLMTLGVIEFGEGGGTTAVAVYAVLMYASDLCWPLLYGISDSLAPAIGFNWGAANYGRVKKIVRCGFIGTAVIGLCSTSLLFFFPGTIASLFVKPEEIHLMGIVTPAIRLFCLAYIFRWVGVMTQSFFSAIEKPALATVMSVSIALIFPVLMLGALWNLGLNGIWLNFFGANALLAILAVVLLCIVGKEIKKKEAEQNK
jgi:Na+-driven multidrug efflux pump